jgi:ferredoxin--NADP+ reductase
VIYATGAQSWSAPDVAEHALWALRSSAIEEVVVLGRRGPAQAAFTSAELRELANLDGVDLRVDPADLELDPVSRAWLDDHGTFTARTMELLRAFALRPPRSGRPPADRPAVPALARPDPRDGRRRGRRRSPQRDRAR